MQSKIEGVWCPFHADKRGSEFVRRVQETGNVFLYCRSCDQTFYMKRYEEVDADEPATEPKFSDFFDVSDLPRIGKFADAADRASRQSLGSAFRKNKCVYTTTEIITKQAIERLLKRRQEYLVVHDKMEGVVGGKITVLGTDKVY